MTAMDKDTKDTEEKKESPESAEEESEEKPVEDGEPEPALAKRAKPRKKPAGEAKDKPEEPEEPEEEAGGEEDEVKKAREKKSQATDELLKSRERTLRIAADFENYRKRAKKDLEEAEHKARVSLLKEMLPVFDNLARAVEHGSEVQDAKPIIEGARMVTMQFEENLAKFGLKRIESVGKVFDPTIHDAISQEESHEAKPGTIIKEFLAGYMLGDRLLRASMVVVARAGAGSGSGEEGEGKD